MHTSGKAEVPCDAVACRWAKSSSIGHASNCQPRLLHTIIT
jgi:hypothetical protein